MSAIPAELTARSQWVVWRYEERDGKRTKVPFVAAAPRDRGAASGVQRKFRASSTNPATWRSYHEACHVAEHGEFDGIGFVFSADDPFCGVDFDNCLNDGEMHPRAAGLALGLGSYTEITPSCNGLHVIVRAELGDGRRTGLTPWGGEFEVYDRGRYFTMTGRHLAGAPVTVNDRQDQLAEVLAEVFPPEPPRQPPRPAVPVSLDDRELLERAHAAKNGAKFSALWGGDVSGNHDDESRADLALCDLLAFWTGGDAARIDSLFRQSGRMRAKWDRDDYRHRTIAKALSGRTEFYDSANLERRANLMVVERDEPAGSAPAPPATQSWPPPMGEAAYHGIVGKVARTIEPHTEADVHAIIVQALVAFGNVIGRGAAFQVEADLHSTALYALIVGETSRGRKGTSWGYVRRLIETADSDYVARRTEGGLSSGEGLVWAVRDVITKLVKVKADEFADEAVDGWHEETVDPGEQDKRLLVVEAEFAQALKVMARPGNTLSAAIRGLWDRGTAGMLTKNSPAKTTNAHVSIIGHIVRDELRREMTTTEVANGFANRILFVCAKRSKLLPHGGGLPDDTWLAFELSDIAEAARTIGKGPPLGWEADARSLWEDIYADLSQGHPGMLGAVTARAEAQVVRLALIYAVLDGRTSIRVDHLRAAREVWRYCEDSARYVFGDATGDPVADEVLGSLRRAGARGMTRTDIRDLFSRHARADRLGQALTNLAAARLAVMSQEGTGGRPVERWHASEHVATRDISDQSDQRGVER